MKLESQVCTLEQGKRLSELGVDWLSYFTHVHLPKTVYRNEDQVIGTPQFVESVTDKGEIYPAFTVAELGLMLPDEIPEGGYTYGFTQERVWEIWVTGYYAESETTSWSLGEKEFCDKSEAQSRAATLIYLLENKYLTPEEVNNRLQNS